MAKVTFGQIIQIFRSTTVLQVFQNVGPPSSVKDAFDIETFQCNNFSYIQSFYEVVHDNCSAYGAPLWGKSILVVIKKIGGIRQIIYSVY